MPQSQSDPSLRRKGQTTRLSLKTIFSVYLRKTNRFFQGGTKDYGSVYPRSSCRVLAKDHPGLWAETSWTISETMDGRKRHPGAKLLPLATALPTTGLCGNEGERLSSCCNRKIGAGFLLKFRVLPVRKHTRIQSPMNQPLLSGPRYFRSKSPMTFQILF